MADENGKLTEFEGKRTKQVMVRLPRSTTERIDDFAGDTHSSRPDFITDAVRQYIVHVLKESADVIIRIEGLEVSKQAKEVYFLQEMGNRLYPEFESYRKSKDGNQKAQDVSVLISMPLGLQREITETVESTGLFSGTQEFIKVSIHYMFGRMSDVNDLKEVVKGFQALPDGSKALEEELDEIRRELNNRRSCSVWIPFRSGFRACSCCCPYG